MFGRIGRSEASRRAVGETLAAWLKFVHGTSQFGDHPGDLYGELRSNYPYIVAMWHGQHFLVPFMRREGHQFKVLISLHGDGEINAVAVRRLGLGLIRGSGGKARWQRRKGGAIALRRMLATLQGGESVAVTADVPKICGVAGLGIVMLAKYSGRPIVPVAVATSNMFRLETWDRATINLPFSRGAFVVGDLIQVPASADTEAMEAKRLEVEQGLNAVHHRAYAAVGRNYAAAAMQRPTATIKKGV
jgi:lysophospholipid acyltransferase (LPLAT)-like uncharacterized protein